MSIQPTGSVPHVWTRDIEHLETLSLKNGRTARGSPSRLSKAEIFKVTYFTEILWTQFRFKDTYVFQNFLSLKPEFDSLSYNDVKQKAASYQTMKNMFYEKVCPRLFLELLIMVQTLTALGLRVLLFSSWVISRKRFFYTMPKSNIFTKIMKYSI